MREVGAVKVLDFGLAKALDGHAAAKRAPALTSLAGAKHGTILDTAAYMRSEQARGRTIDKRADIWKLGESWALSRDGQRILVLTSTAAVWRTKIRVVSHWVPSTARRA